ncbi:hypothetical protein F4804DRAFT_12006 [Jackrogersella minutella]|nr:hypothetical protein F4804DRAFT_12006 [Jackrogersella minutella]
MEACFMMGMRAMHQAKLAMKKRNFRATMLRLGRLSQHARRSILLAPPTKAFSGLWSVIRRRHNFRVTQTPPHKMCRWIVVSSASFITWLRMPIDPNTIAGAIIT